MSDAEAPIVYVPGTSSHLDRSSPERIAQRAEKIRAALSQGTGRNPPPVRAVDYRAVFADFYPKARETLDEPPRTIAEAKVACVECGGIRQVRLPTWGPLQELAVDHHAKAKALLDRPGMREAAIACVLEVLSPRTRVLIGHGMGSIVAALALSQARVAAPVLLKTTGSPLAIEDLAQRMGRVFVKWAYERADSWVNVHDKCDFATGGSTLNGSWFPDVLQIRVRNSRWVSEANHDKTRYLAHPPVAGLIVDLAEGRIPTNRLRFPSRAADLALCYPGLRPRGYSAGRVPPFGVTRGVWLCEQGQLCRSEFGCGDHLLGAGG